MKNLNRRPREGHIALSLFVTVVFLGSAFVLADVVVGPIVGHRLSYAVVLWISMLCLFPFIWFAIRYSSIGDALYIASCILATLIAYSIWILVNEIAASGQTQPSRYNYFVFAISVICGVIFARLGYKWVRSRQEKNTSDR